MTTKMKLELETAIDKWFDKYIENQDRPDVYFSEDLVERMTSAAIAVLEQNNATAKYYEENVVK